MTSRHLKITFTDGETEELESKFSFVDLDENTITPLTARVGGTQLPGPTYPLVNIKKYEWVEGYK